MNTRNTGRTLSLRSTLGSPAVRHSIIAISLIAGAAAAKADWFINKDVEQRDARPATDFDILFQGDISGRITGGGQSPVTNAFANPRRTVGGDGLGNTIVRFDSSSGGTIPQSAGTNRHFGVRGSDPQPRALQFAWSYATVPQRRVRVAALNFKVDWNAASLTAVVTVSNEDTDPVSLIRTGFLVSSTPFPLESLNAQTLPTSMFAPVSTLPSTFAPSFFDVFTIPNVSFGSSIVLNADMQYSNPIAPGMNDGPSHDWWQIVIPAPSTSAPLALGLFAIARRRRRVAQPARPSFRARSAAATAILLAATGIATADEVFVIPLKTGQPTNAMPTFRLRYMVGAPPMQQDIQVGIDTGNGLPNHGGLIINSGAANNVAGRLGLNPAGPGTAPLAAGGVGGPAAGRTNVPMPGGAPTFASGAPAVPPGQVNTAPPIPGSCNTMSLPASMDALMGKQWLANYNYAHFGDFWVMGAKKATPAGSAQNLATGNAIAAFLSGGTVLGPDGRPLGALNRPVNRTIVSTPPGTVPMDDGYAVATGLTNPLGGQTNAPMLIKTGFQQTIISESLAAQLNLNIGSLPTQSVPLQLVSSAVLPVASLNVDVFGNAASSFTMSVAILPNSMNPFNLSYLGADYLSHFFYWEVSTTLSGETGSFYAAVPAPPSGSLLALGALAWSRRRRKPLTPA